MENTTMPAVIVEVGFISNQREGRLLVDDEYQSKVAMQFLESLNP